MVNDVIPCCGDDEIEIIVYSPFVGFKLRAVKAIMQFTGLLDKNGREIYEGDVLKFHDRSTDQVFYDQGTVQFTMQNRWLWPYTSGSEVIGNIYENPELLEGGSAE